MKLHIEHTFRGIELPAYEKLYFDEAFNIELCKATHLERHLVRREEKGGKLERLVRIAPEREIPAPVAKVLGSGKLEYAEHITYELGKYRAHWRTEPAVLRDKIESQGTFVFEKTASGVKRIVDGQISVKIFGLGAVIERFVVADVERSYDKASEFTQKWIDEHQGKV